MKLEKIIFLGRSKEIEWLQKAIELLPENTIMTYGYPNNIEYDLLACISADQIKLSPTKENLHIRPPEIPLEINNNFVRFNYKDNTYLIKYAPLKDEDKKSLF